MKKLLREKERGRVSVNGTASLRLSFSMIHPTSSTLSCHALILTGSWLIILPEHNNSKSIFLSNQTNKWSFHLLQWVHAIWNWINIIHRHCMFHARKLWHPRIEIIDRILRDSSPPPSNACSLKFLPEARAKRAIKRNVKWLIQDDPRFTPFLNSSIKIVVS